jgi:4-oxalocrotonate tautomerase
VTVLRQSAQTSVVLIEEIEADNWGIGGESITRRRARYLTSRTTES